MGNRKIKEMMIKIIDWSSRIIAVLLAIGSSFLAISDMIMNLSTKIGVIEPTLRTIVVLSIGMAIIVIVCSALQLGLFLAPTVRTKMIRYKLGVAVLMLPITIIFFSIIANVTKMKVVRGIPLNIAETIGFSVCSIGFIVYIIQYYLLFQGKKINTYIPSLEQDTIFKPATSDGLGEPLFVLKYPWWNVCGGIFMVIVSEGGFLLLIVYLLLSNIPSWVLKIGLILGVILIVARGIWGIMELLLFKNVKLYRSRIVKSWYLLGQKEVKLEDAYISKSGDFLFIHGLRVKIYVRKKRFGLRMGVSFVEDLLTRKDRREFYNILAELSGRDVKDLLGSKLKSFKPDIWTKKSIKEDNKQ